jgi:N-acetylmuramoyl-L-alanine amidase
VHHSASNQPPAGQEEAFSRQIESYGEGRDGAAIEYNYLVYPTGVLHGGFGDTRGCHAVAPDPSTGRAFNSSSIGICFIGFFHPPYNHEPTPEAVAVFQAWLAWMVGSGRLTDDVLARAISRGQPGWYGHRDVGATACPGNVLYPLLPSIIQAGNVPAPTPTPTPGGNDLVNTLIIVDDAYARFAGDADNKGIIHFMRYLGPELNKLIGFQPDNVTPRIDGTDVIHRKQAELNTITLVGPKPTGDKVDWTDDNFYQGA